MKKKVIFVGGTSYSGSTFFHLTLANDPAGFAVGEVNHLFAPTKERHLRSTWQCGCGDPSCVVWDEVKKRGADALYETIFELHPEVDFIVDSSKNIVWTAEQSERLTKRGIEAERILIWKTPLEFAYSLQKRNRLHEGEGLLNWPRYYRLYYSFMDKWRAVRYSEYANQQGPVLAAACDYLGIPYYPGKERFWEKTYHLLGGNLSSRIHLYSQNSRNYQDVERRAAGSKRELGGAEEHHREVYYEDPNRQDLRALADKLRADVPLVDQIEEMLIDRSVLNQTTPREWPDLVLSPAEKRLVQVRQHTKARWGKLRFGFRSRQSERQRS